MHQQSGSGRNDGGDEVKAVTLWQPWASLIAWGEKQYETRSWGTAYRGDLAIHAGKHLERYSSFWHELYSKYDLINVPLGMIVAVVRLETVIRMDRNLIAMVSNQEYSVGNWEEGRWAWLLTDIRPLAEPILAKGKQGLWTWDDLPGEIR